MGNLGLDPCGLHFSKSKKKTPGPAQEPGPTQEPVAVQQAPATMMVAPTYYIYPPMFVMYQPATGYYYPQQQTVAVATTAKGQIKK